MGARITPHRRLRFEVASIVCAALCLGAPAPVSAVVSDVRLLDGPSERVIDLADAAMSEDGTGGVVWLREEDDRAHVYAARFRDGAWFPPQRVDVGQDFDSSWPRIGAGDGGRLVVTWVQEFGVESDRMFSATLDPGAVSFQPPIPIDFNVGEATATWPDLAMSRGGQAYLVYRVVTDTSPSNPPGHLGADLRVARYNGRLWSRFGTPIDRNIATPVRKPDEGNAPEIEVDLQGQGVVAWQEPDDEFVDRVWARRLFGMSTGIPLLVSPSVWEGEPLRGAAGSFSLDVSGFGQAAVAFRQQPGLAGKLNASRIMVNEMPDVFAETAGAFSGAYLADGGARPLLGAPSIGVDPRGLNVTGFGTGNASLLGSGDDVAAFPLERLDTGASAAPGEPLVDLAESGAVVAAWREIRADAGLVGIQERRADKVVEPTLLTAPLGGAVESMELGGSGLGDAIVAWVQGEGERAQLAATVVNAPPDPFLVLLPEGWQRTKRIPIAWDEAPNAIGGVRYSVSVDDEPVLEGLDGHKAPLPRDLAGDGRHQIQVFATDTAGQETGSRTGVLRVDRRGPRVRVRRRGRKLTVIATDGGRHNTSGVRRGTVKVDFGEGPGGGGKKQGAVVSKRRRNGRAGKRSGRRKGPIVVRRRHTYSRAGSFKLTVRARDRAGNVRTIKRRIRVR